MVPRTPAIITPFVWRFYLANAQLSTFCHWEIQSWKTLHHQKMCPRPYLQIRWKTMLLFNLQKVLLYLPWKFECCFKSKQLRKLGIIPENNGNAVVWGKLPFSTSIERSQALGSSSVLCITTDPGSLLLQRRPRQVRCLRITWFRQKHELEMSKHILAETLLRNSLMFLLWAIASILAILFQLMHDFKKAL